MSSDVTIRGREIIRHAKVKGVTEVHPDDLLALAAKTGGTPEYLRKLVNGEGLRVTRWAQRVWP